MSENKRKGCKFTLEQEQEIIKDISGEEHECYCLSSIQHNHPLGSRRVWHYFDVETYKCIIT